MLCCTVPHTHGKPASMQGPFCIKQHCGDMAAQQRNLKAIVMRATENTWCAAYAQDECVAVHHPLRSQDPESRSEDRHKRSCNRGCCACEEERPAWVTVARCSESQSMRAR